MQNRRRRYALSLLTILVAFLAERRRRHQHQMTTLTTFQASGVAVDAFFFSPDQNSSSFTSFTSRKNATTEEILAVVTVGWEISDDENPEHQAIGERKARLLWQIIENYRSACKNNNNNFKRVTVALAAYVEDEARLRTFFDEESSKREDDDKTARHHRRRVRIFAHVLPLFLLDDDEWGSRAQHERVDGTRVGIASEICKTRESGEGTRVEAVWISRRRTPFGRKPYWTPSFGIFFPASGVFFVVVIVRYWCV